MTTTPDRRSLPEETFVVPPSLSPKTVKHAFPLVEVGVRNLGPTAVEIAVRRPWRELVNEAVQEASGENPEIQGLSDQVRADLQDSLTSTLATGDATALEQAVDAASKKAKLSSQAQTVLLVQLLERLPKGQRDVAVPILSMRSAELVGQRLVDATRGLAVATLVLVIATVVLVIVTATGK
jgi:hypothetical protein